MVEIVRTRQQRRAFIDLPYRLHRSDPSWVAPLRMEVARRLDRRKNPFFREAEAEYWIARESGRVVGRIAGIVNRRHDEVHGDNAAFFGFFETIDDPKVASELLAAATDWAGARGRTLLRGPVSPSMNDECGVLIDGFEAPPTVMMGHNPPYYADLLGEAGFRKAKDLLSYEIDGRSVQMPERLERAGARLARRLNVDFRSIDLSDFDTEVEHIGDLLDAAWAPNWGFVPLTREEITALANDLRPVVVPELVPFATHDGRPIGVGVALPDVNEVLRGDPSGRLFPNVLRLLWRLKRGSFERLRVVLLGVAPEFQKTGIDALLYQRIWKNGWDLGYRWGEAGWILEDNAPMNNALIKMGFSHYKTYRIYERPIPRSGS